MTIFHSFLWHSAGIIVATFMLRTTELTLDIQPDERRRYESTMCRHESVGVVLKAVLNVISAIGMSLIEL